MNVGGLSLFPFIHSPSLSLLPSALPSTPSKPLASGLYPKVVFTVTNKVPIGQGEELVRPETE